MQVNLNMQAFDGVAFRVKGDGMSMKFTLKTKAIDRQYACAYQVSLHGQIEIQQMQIEAWRNHAEQWSALNFLDKFASRHAVPLQTEPEVMVAFHVQPDSRQLAKLVELVHAYQFV